MCNLFKRTYKTLWILVWSVLFYAKKQKEGDFMCDSKVLHLKFVGMGSWERPVYKDGSGTLWKDVDSRARMQPDLCTSANNEFDGELDTGMKYLEEYRGVMVAFEPERIVW